MLSSYRKIIFAPIALYNLENGWHQVIESNKTPEQSDLQILEERSRQLASDWVDQTDVTILLEEMSANTELISAESRTGQKEIMLSVLGNLGAQLAAWNVDWVFQAKWRAWADRRIVHDTYAWLGWEENQALSRNAVASLIEKLGMTRDEIILALWAWNEEYAQMLADTNTNHEEYSELIEAWRVQRGPNVDQVDEMNVMQQERDFMAAEDLLMSQDISSPDISDDVEQVVVAEAPKVNPHPDVVEAAAEEQIVVAEDISEASANMLALLEQGEWKVRFSEIKWSKEKTTSLQTALIETLWLEEIQKILDRPDMTEDKFADGAYGNWTSTVVAEYQRVNDLKVDWEAGTQTFASITGLDYDITTRIASLPVESKANLYASNQQDTTNNVI